jgi:hypothetical protein
MASSTQVPTGAVPTVPPTGAVPTVQTEHRMYVSNDGKEMDKIWVLLEYCVAEHSDGTETYFIKTDPDHIKQFNQKFGTSLNDEVLVELLTADYKKAVEYIHSSLRNVGKKASNLVAILCRRPMKESKEGLMFHSIIRIGLLPVKPKNIALANVSDDLKQCCQELAGDVKVKVKKGKRV